MHKIGEIIFSRGTYEVEVKSGGKSFWPFLRLDREGRLLDSFCSCDKCRHVDAAYKAVFSGQKPLHCLFAESFFNQLGFLLFQRWQKNPRFKDNCFSFDKLKIRLNNRPARQRIAEMHRLNQKEDEFSSLKFATLSAEELASYKEKRASLKLLYELSFFSDLAKWLFLEKDINVLFKGRPLPFKLRISSANITLQMDLQKEELQSLVPFLNTVRSNLKVFQARQIKNAFFDSDKKELNIIFSKTQKDIRGAELGKWVFVEGQGFYPQEKQEPAEQLVLQEKNITDYLNKKAHCLRPFFNIDFQAKTVKNYLFIDQKKNLHIESYLEKKADLTKKGAAVFYPWAFLNEKEIKKLGQRPVFKIIDAEKVGEFVSESRVFLQNIEGFNIHFGAFAEKLDFKINKNGNLKFERKLASFKDAEEIIDYGPWVYVKNKGFYSKKSIGLPFLPKMVKKENISAFLSRNKQQLEQIPGFFLDESPIEKTGLKIELDQENRIVVSPQIVPKKDVRLERLKFFEPFIFLEKKGFFELPPHCRLPEGYRKIKKIKPAEESFFVHYELERLKPFALQIDERLRRPKQLNLKLRQLKKDKNTVLAGLSYVSSMGEIDAISLHQAVQSHKKYAFTPAGLIFLRGRRFKWLSSINPKRALKKSRLFRLKIWEWIKLSVWEKIRRPSGKTAKIKKMQKVFDSINCMQEEESLDLSLLKSTLRPYQKTGVKWLGFLYKEGLSGILCDEMGLGKTHQAMGLLAAVMKKDETRKNKYLVVCPTSVIYHWENLLKEFLPEAKVCVFHGLGRSLDDSSNLILTSYGLARAEQKLLQNLEFEIVVFDELQTAKNKSSKINQALRKISSSMYLGLTGTPLENRLEELKALFDLILPGYFPSDKAFKELFINPIEKEKDEKQKKVLKNLVRPFVLRRKKKEVLKDLPDKIEEIAYAELVKEQKQLYTSLLAMQKPVLLSELGDKNNKQACLHVFSVLSKLKQLCDHPVLLDSKYARLPSGKWELFKELIKEALASEQKVVVFSQYLEMIEMIKGFLDKNHIKYACITGSVQNRFEEVKKFQNNPSCMVFVGSLLASGVGIDLTAGSVVIHYDRWWNPAKENQATDRVHRIGQNRGVQVFKLTTKNTIEERIHQLIEKKKNLIEETVGADDQEVLKKLTREELAALLQDF